MGHKNIGDSFDTFLEEGGILEHAEAVATKRLIAFQIKQEMERKNLTRAALARRMKTSRSALNRLLDPTNDSITVKTLQRAAKSLGKRIEIRLI